MPSSVPNVTSFKVGNIRSKVSIIRQRITLKKQYAEGLRNVHENFRNTPGYLKKPKSKRLCEKCGKEYSITGTSQRWCKECVPDNIQRSIMQRYNLNKKEYDNLLITNSGLCYICLKRKSKVIDHCHKTGRVRGLLCYSCNFALGIIEDKDRLRRALEYVAIR